MGVSQRCICIHLPAASVSWGSAPQHRDAAVTCRGPAELCCLAIVSPWESASEDPLAQRMPVNLLPDIQREWVHPCKESYHLWGRLSPTAPHATPSREPGEIMLDFQLRDGLAERPRERRELKTSLPAFQNKEAGDKTVCSKASCARRRGTRCYRQQRPPVGTLLFIARILPEACS